MNGTSHFIAAATPTAAAVWAGLVLSTTAFAPAAFRAPICWVRSAAVSLIGCSAIFMFHCWPTNRLPSTALSP